MSGSRISQGQVRRAPFPLVKSKQAGSVVLNGTKIADALDQEEVSASRRR